MTDSSTHNQLLESQRQLAAEELYLKKSLARIEEQINVLQIEQLHLIALLKKSSKESTMNAQSQAGTATKVEELNLDVPIHMKVYLEEAEEEEEDEDEEDDVDGDF